MVMPSFAFSGCSSPPPPHSPSIAPDWAGRFLLRANSFCPFSSLASARRTLLKQNALQNVCTGAVRILLGSRMVVVWGVLVFRFVQITNLFLIFPGSAQPKCLPGKLVGIFFLFFFFLSPPALERTAFTYSPPTGLFASWAAFRRAIVLISFIHVISLDTLTAYLLRPIGNWT